MVIVKFDRGGGGYQSKVASDSLYRNRHTLEKEVCLYG